MARIHPRSPPMIDGRISQYSSSEREIFTVWMKSLVISSNGCTVYSSKGEVVFRVDNYQTRRSSEVLLMGSNGEVLFSIKRKVTHILYLYPNVLLYKLLTFGRWEGRKLVNSRFEKEGEWFRVKRKCKLLRRGRITCHVILGLIKHVLQVMQKQSMMGVGVCFGDDVLSLMVEPHVDHSLIMALIIVYGMINNKL
ncbi:PREDICTED: protein LURP-one-related 2-like [Erythranthe guttata]|uniref:protein LURP-one-related 2-like n=1 Tax=Erythranthe guttata TaxID=4155 RepID=UPI00064D7484|nr:PREDICTED: protein LURP-one-related 2-like [Erythranthe guttata]|eukprot:XP_012836243.1 PREDICTED: protein LURP-one-related 2-like [Erythranthe guttata]